MKQRFYTEKEDDEYRVIDSKTSQIMAETTEGWIAEFLTFVLNHNDDIYWMTNGDIYWMTNGFIFVAQTLHNLSKGEDK